MTSNEILKLIKERQRLQIYSSSGFEEAVLTILADVITRLDDIQWKKGG